MTRHKVNESDSAWPSSAKMTEILERELFRHNCHDFYNYVLGDPYREDSKRLRSLNPNVQNITRDEAAKMTKPYSAISANTAKLREALKTLPKTSTRQGALLPGMSPEDVNWDSLSATKARGYPVFDGVPAPVSSNENKEQSYSPRGDGWRDTDTAGMMRRSYDSLFVTPKSCAAVTIKGVCAERKSKSEPIDLSDWIQRPMGVPCTIPKRFKTEL